MLYVCANLRPQFSAWNWFFAAWVFLCGSFSSLAVQSVALTWSPSTDTNAVGYKVYYGGQSGVYTNTVWLGLVTNTLVTGMVEGGTYYFSATTVSAAGMESPFSNEASYVLPQPTNSVATNPPDSGSTVVTVLAPPTLDPVANVTIYENAGTKTVNLTGITTGPTATGAALSLSVVAGSQSFISPPTVAYGSPDTTGYLTFAPLTNVTGTTTVTVTVNNGAASNNLATQTFTITVLPVAVLHQPPGLNPIADVNLVQGTASQSITLTGLTTGAAANHQRLRVTAGSSNPQVIPNPIIRYMRSASTAQLQLHPAFMAVGTATVTVTVDGGGGSNDVAQQSFVVTVSSNQPPTLDAIPNLTILTNAGIQTVTLTGITSGSPTEHQVLKISASSNNPRLITLERIQYTNLRTNATLRFFSQGNNVGTAMITVTVNDGARNNNLVRRQFLVTVASTPAVNIAGGGTPGVGGQTVQRLPAVMQALATASGNFRFQVTGTPAAAYVVEASSNLVNWERVATNTSPFVYSETSSGYPQRFYRAVAY